MSASKVSRGLVDMILFAIIAVWDVIESVVFVAGIFICIMLPVSWPMKFVYMAVWLIATYAISKLVSKLHAHRKKGQH